MTPACLAVQIILAGLYDLHVIGHGCAAGGVREF
jgi:hypothetical protein